MGRDLYEVRNSGIHGRGVFARRAIEAGDRIIEYIGERIDKEESTKRSLDQMEKAKETGEGSVYIFELDDEWDLDGNFAGNIARLVNHSCSPNCEAVNEDGRIWFFALDDITEGEELTYDYGYDIEHFLDHPCRCGSPECMGYIVRRDQWKKLKKLLRGRKPGKKKT